MDSNKRLTSFFQTDENEKTTDELNEEVKDSDDVGTDTPANGDTTGNYSSSISSSDFEKTDRYS